MPDVLDVAPAVEPVSIAEAKAHLNVTEASDDTYITSLIVVAREWVEKQTQRALITQTRSLYCDAFVSVREIANPPLQSVAQITYVDDDGSTQVLVDTVYAVDAFSTPGKVRLGYNQSWPSVRAVANAVRIQYLAGYGDASTAVPQPIKQAMLLMVGQWYENREPVVFGTIVAKVPYTVDALLSPYKLIRA